MAIRNKRIGIEPKYFVEECETASGGQGGDLGGASKHIDKNQGASEAEGEDERVQRRLGGPQVRQGGVADLQPRDGAPLLLQALQPARPGQLHAPASEVSRFKCSGVLPL